LAILNIGCPCPQEELDAAYNDGYGQGYDDGNIDGYNKGEVDGYVDGYKDGVVVGYDDGFDAGRTVGDAEGYARGYAKGYSEGYQKGREECEEPTSVFFIRILSITPNPAGAGNEATLRALTLPNALCTITVHYKSGPGTADGLKPTPTADSSGIVSWTWLVGGATTPGSWPCVVTASLDGQFATDEEYIVVT
jgi:hypothetical protein